MELELVHTISHANGGGSRIASKSWALGALVALVDNQKIVHGQELSGQLLLLIRYQRKLCHE